MDQCSRRRNINGGYKETHESSSSSLMETRSSVSFIGEEMSHLDDGEEFTGSSRRLSERNRREMKNGWFVLFCLNDEIAL